MSFSLKVKDELCRVEDSKECCKKIELYGLIRHNINLDEIMNNRFNISLKFENPKVARKVFKLVKEVFDVNPEILVRKSGKLKKKNLYLILITKIAGSKKILDDILNYESEIFLDESKVIKNNCCKKAYLRGCFLVGGSIINPEKSYHFEIISPSNEKIEYINAIMNYFNLNPRITKRRKYFMLYIKEGDKIVDALNVMGAHTALLDLENTRILKDMRNNINRVVNCETANLSKTVNASINQIESIEKIINTIGINSLPESLRQIAVLRLENKDASLKELGELSIPPVGKSGVNHRLKKIEKIAKNIK